MQVELDYVIADGLTLGVNLSHDETFETRVSGNISCRFGSNSSASISEKKAWEKPTIQSLSESVENRNIRVHDPADPKKYCKVFNPRNGYFIGSVATHSAMAIHANWHCNPGAPKATASGWEPA